MAQSHRSDSSSAIRQRCNQALRMDPCSTSIAHRRSKARGQRCTHGPRRENNRQGVEGVRVETLVLEAVAWELEVPATATAVEEGPEGKWPGTTEGDSGAEAMATAAGVVGAASAAEALEEAVRGMAATALAGLEAGGGGVREAGANMV